MLAGNSDSQDQTVQTLTLKAGPSAMRKIREKGLTPALVRKVVGASGGAKWLSLRQIDRIVFGEFLKDADHHIDLIGSSIGAWRMALAALADPVAEWQRFEDLYLSYKYEKGMTVDDVTRDTWHMVRELLPEDKCREAVSNPLRNINIVAVRCKGIAAMESRLPLAASMLATAGANAVSRKSLGLFYDRVVLHSHEQGVEGMEGYNRQDIRLTAGNLPAAVVASGSIPFVTHGVRDFEGSRPGIYRDGGFTDYHFDEPWRGDDGIVLYPHFYDYLVPGWFDKGIRSRRTSGAAVDDVLLISPSREFVQTYLGGDIPDRRNFTSMDNETRLAFWRTTLDEGNRMADELSTLLGDHGKLMDSLELFE